jgi:hypothetical protein
VEVRILIAASACRISHVALSEPFEALSIDLQARLYLAQSSIGDSHSSDALWETVNTFSIPVQRLGRWNAVAFWFEVRRRSRQLREWSQQVFSSLEL